MLGTASVRGVRRGECKIDWQSSGCAPIVRAYEQGSATAEPWQNAATIADGLRVPAAVGDLLIVPNGPVPIPLAGVADDEVRLAAEALAGFRDDFPDVSVEERLVRSPAVRALLTAVDNPAMIVVGSRGHGPTIGALLGSVSNGVLHKAKVPVAVIPLVDSGPRAA